MDQSFCLSLLMLSCIFLALVQEINAHVTSQQLFNRSEHCINQLPPGGSFIFGQYPQNKDEIKSFCNSTLAFEGCMGNIQKELLKGDYSQNGGNVHPEGAITGAIMVHLLGKMCTYHLPELLKHYDCVRNVTTDPLQADQYKSCELTHLSGKHPFVCKEIELELKCVIKHLDATCPGINAAFDKLTADVMPEVKEACEKVEAS